MRELFFSEQYQDPTRGGKFLVNDGNLFGSVKNQISTHQHFLNYIIVKYRVTLNPHH